MKKNQKGFSAVEALLIFVTLGVIGFVGWYVINAKNGTRTDQTNNSQDSQENKNSSNTQIPAETIPTGYKKYEDEAENFSLYYPSDWELESRKADDRSSINIKAGAEAYPYFGIDSDEKSSTNNCSSELFNDRNNGKKIKIDNIDAYQLDSDSRGDFTVQTCFEKEGFIYRLDYHHKDGQKEQDLAKYNQLVESFKFN